MKLRLCRVYKVAIKKVCRKKELRAATLKTRAGSNPASVDSIFGVSGNYRQVTARCKLVARFMHVEGLIA